jgi:hypothetical protein
MSYSFWNAFLIFLDINDTFSDKDPSLFEDEDNNGGFITYSSLQLLHFRDNSALARFSLRGKMENNHGVPSSKRWRSCKFYREIYITDEHLCDLAKRA